MTNNKREKRETVIGVFHSTREAQKAVRELMAAGFDDSQIGLAAQDQDGSYEEQTEGNKAGKGAAVGAATGLGAGTLWGLGIAAGFLPAIGPFIAGGVLAAVAASAAGTAAAGGVVGALIGLGIPEEEAKYYEGEFNQGRTIVTVHAKERFAEAHRILDDANAYDFQRAETDHAKNPRAPERQNADGKMVARKEVLDVDKHQRTAGQVEVRKEVRTDMKSVEVPVKREELVIERTDMHGKAAAPISGKSEPERVTLREEVVDVNKRTVAKESVAVGKRTVEDTKKVGAKLREEEIVVKRDNKNKHDEHHR